MSQPKIKGRRGLSVKASLMLTLVLFMALLLAVGAIAVAFLQQSLQATQQLGTVAQRSSEASRINSALLSARASLLTAAHEQAEGQAGNARTAVTRAEQSVKAAKDIFRDFQNNALDSEEGRPLYMGVLRAYRGYIDDGIDTMVDAMASGDYISFYMINTEYDAPLGDAFTESITTFTD